MKIRKGYVSNSSSSSFLILGIRISNDKLNEPKYPSPVLVSTYSTVSVDDFIRAKEQYAKVLEQYELDLENWNSNNFNIDDLCCEPGIDILEVTSAIIIGKNIGNYIKGYSNDDDRVAEIHGLDTQIVELEKILEKYDLPSDEIKIYSGIKGTF